MLRVEVDIFSGRPNPVWIITDTDQSNELLGAIRASSGAGAESGAGLTGFGYREVRTLLLADDEPRRTGVPREFAVGSIAATNRRASREMATRVCDTMLRNGDVRLLQHELTP